MRAEKGVGLVPGTVSATPRSSSGADEIDMKRGMICKVYNPQKTKIEVKTSTKTGINHTFLIFWGWLLYGNMVFEPANCVGIQWGYDET